MAEEDITAPSSTMVPSLTCKQVESASKYHSFEFVSTYYIPMVKTFLEPKLSRTSWWLVDILWNANMSQEPVWANVEMGFLIYRGIILGYNLQSWV